MSRKAQNIKVIKNEQKPETPEVLASALILISEGFEKLSRQGNLTNEGIAALLKSMKGLSDLRKEDILLVLENLPKLKSYYIRK